MALVAASAQAQVTPTPENPPPDDNPSVRLGGTLFADYTKTLAPQVLDANGNRVSPSAFNVTRAYINVAGQLNHVFAFRITPDITRETGGGSSLAGSETLRLKYGYVQANLDDWLWRGTYVRAGMIQTPFVDFEESGLPVSLPGDDIHRARRLHDLVRLRRRRAYAAAARLWRGARRALQRRRLRARRSERPESH